MLASEKHRGNISCKKLLFWKKNAQTCHAGTLTRQVFLKLQLREHLHIWTGWTSKHRKALTRQVLLNLQLREHLHIWTIWTSKLRQDTQVQTRLSRIRAYQLRPAALGLSPDRSSRIYGIHCWHRVSGIIFHSMPIKQDTTLTDDCACMHA